jgi:hypothetical protein
MSDRGLSIFDDDEPDDRPDEGEELTGEPVPGQDVERTQVLPVAPSQPLPQRPQPTQQQSAQQPAQQAAPRPAPQPAAPQPAPPGSVAEAAQVYARQTVVPPAAAPQPGSIGLPTVRRGGYDKNAVDARLRHLAGEQERLGSTLSQAHSRIGELESSLDSARRELEVNRIPS